MTESTAEGFLPILSAGRHRNAKRGACFMEYASYLAGERWSDRPSCTHPSLAALARLINDLTSDDARSELATLIPSVVGPGWLVPQLYLSPEACMGQALCKEFSVLGVAHYGAVTRA